MKVLEKKLNRLGNGHERPIQKLKETVGEVKSSINNAVSILNDLLNFDKVDTYYIVCKLVDPLTLKFAFMTFSPLPATTTIS